MMKSRKLDSSEMKVELSYIKVELISEPFWLLVATHNLVNKADSVSQQLLVAFNFPAVIVESHSVCD